MKDRRPRKLKKQLKARYVRAIAFRTVATATISAVAAVQTAMVASRPIRKHDPAGLADKAMATVKIAMDCANTVAGILKSGPKNWREV